MTETLKDLLIELAEDDDNWTAEVIAEIILNSAWYYEAIETARLEGYDQGRIAESSRKAFGW